jgi:hypothetical protein
MASTSSFMQGSSGMWTAEWKRAISTRPMPQQKASTALLPMDTGEPVREPAPSLPFRLRGHDGRVLVDYTPDQDSVHWGFDLPRLLAEPFDVALAQRYPISEARRAARSLPD